MTETIKKNRTQPSIRANRGGARGRRGVPPKQRSRSPASKLGVALMFLLTVAATGIAWSLPEHPSLDHPLARLVCRFIFCGDLTPPAQPFQNIAQISMHNIRLTKLDNKLSLTGYLTNNAEQSQPHPTLIIQLYTVDGRLVSKHVVNPPNYLAEASDLPIMVGQTQTIKYTLSDPGIVAMQYTLRLENAVPT